MLFQRSTRAVQSQWHLYRSLAPRTTQATRSAAIWRAATRGFHTTQILKVIKPVLLADIGEGIVECEIIQWFVEPEARVEEFSPLCEVQSDKASVEITSRFAGVVKKLHYDAGEMARVGKPFVDIDIQGDANKEALDKLTPSEPAQDVTPSKQNEQSQHTGSTSPKPSAQHDGAADSSVGQTPAPKAPKGRHASLATPAVRHLSKELDIDISQIDGTGREGRVLKEDIYKYVQAKKDAGPDGVAGVAGANGVHGALSAQFTPISESGVQNETPVQLTNTQLQMFRAMTKSLSIPHFLYADEVDFTSLFELRARLNKVLAKSAKEGEVSKLSYLPFVIKAVSMALYKYPILNARVDVDANTSKPALVLRSQHNIGVAMDTPSGLLVPVIKNVGALNVLCIAAELARLQALAHAGRLSPQDLGGGTITVSNIGNIGGTYLSPVIVEREVGILGIGRMRTVPAFDERDNVVKRRVCNFSWSADHRVVDGATMARAAEVVRQILEEPDVMVIHLR